MAYAFQTFTFNEVLSSTKMNNIEINIRDHVHGEGGVVSLPSSSVTGLGSLAALNTAPVANGGTGAATAPTARTNLGVGSLAVLNTAAIANGGTGATTAANARSNLGLGFLSTLNTAPIANGGTGATTAANARSNLGLAIGSNVQAYSAQIPFRNVNQGWSQQQYFGLLTLTDGATINWDLNSRQVAIVTLGGNRTLANPSNIASGGTYMLIVKQDATGSRTLAYGTKYKWKGGVAPTLSTGANAVDLLSFISDGTNMYGVATKGFA